MCANMLMRVVYEYCSQIRPLLLVRELRGFFFANSFLVWICFGKKQSQMLAYDFYSIDIFPSPSHAIGSALTVDNNKVFCFTSKSRKNILPKKSISDWPSSHLLPRVVSYSLILSLSLSFSICLSSLSIRLFPAPKIERATMTDEVFHLFI